jgi:hypothetical protein
MSHGGIMADILTEGSTAIFVDFSPEKKDEQQLRKCRLVIIMDHHPTAVDAQNYLQMVLPQLKNLSRLGVTECGATLAQKFCTSQRVPKNILHLFHKLDVFEHTPPAEVMEDFYAFKGFIMQNGLDNCTIDLVDHLLEYPGESMAKGLQLYDRMVRETGTIFSRRKLMQDTGEIFERKRLVAETCHISVYVVEFGLEGEDDGWKLFDNTVYQALIDEIVHDDDIVFVTINRILKPNGTFNIGFRRSAGDTLDVGAIAQRLSWRSDLGFSSGGGYLYAAGAQHNNVDLSAEELCEAIKGIVTDLMTEASIYDKFD